MPTRYNPFALVAGWWRRSLSAKLFILTIGMILLIEAVILAPSIAKQYRDALKARIDTAYLVSLALETPEFEMIDKETADELFATSNIAGVSLLRDGARYQILAPSMAAEEMEISRAIDLRGDDAMSLMREAWAVILSRGEGYLQVSGAPARNVSAAVDVVISERAVRRELQRYAVNILLLSLLISAATAVGVYWALNRIIVAPVKSLTRKMAAFERDPSARMRDDDLSGRVDEIGDAERGLTALQQRVRSQLAEQRRLAALGAGISKISHDLRNVLASAQLMSDRLARSDDPRVRKLSPRLISSLDRAIQLSNDTLRYGRLSPETLQKARFPVRPLIDDVFDDAAAIAVSFRNDTPDGLEVDADRTQLYRALFNLVRNAVDALTTEDGLAPPGRPAPTIAVSARRVGRDDIEIDVSDNGPGLPEHAVAHLFEPFRGSKKPGGSGLGVAIAYEILEAHGGKLALVKSDATGATFRLTAPVAARDR
ncbi:MAG: HAMP domain-containing sensor histidine kinase [Pseudomonadota bacterium]